MWNKDEVEGKAEEVKGRAKKAAAISLRLPFCGG